jgi:putative acetyltransferase
MLNQERFTVRHLEVADVHAVLKVISDCRREYGLENRVHAVLEPSDHNLFETYRIRRSAYFVVIVDSDVVGGAGISRLRDCDGSICELQRMYLRPACRGLGIGRALLQQCVRAAQQFGYEQCYAETILEMTTAVTFYERHGFLRLKAPLGDSGHSHNDCWLLLQLHPPGAATARI